MNRSPMRRCGKPYRTEADALASRRGRTGRYLAVPCRCTQWHLRSKAAATATAGRRLGAAKRHAAKVTGFPPAVRKACRRRAGDRCEACGVYLPPGFGQVQHRDARGMGGSCDPLVSSAVNAALLCGTPQTGCHGLCEAWDRHMHEAGFWLKTGESPLEVPILLHGEHGSGMRLWLTPEGGYSEYSPAARGEAA